LQLTALLMHLVVIRHVDGVRDRAAQIAVLVEQRLRHAEKRSLRLPKFEVDGLADQSVAVSRDRAEISILRAKKIIKREAHHLVRRVVEVIQPRSAGPRHAQLQIGGPNQPRRLVHRQSRRPVARGSSRLSAAGPVTWIIPGYVCGKTEERY